MRVANRDELAKLSGKPPAAEPSKPAVPTVTPKAPARVTYPGLDPKVLTTLHSTAASLASIATAVNAIAQQLNTPKPEKQLRASIERDKDGRMSNVLVTIVQPN